MPDADHYRTAQAVIKRHRQRAVEHADRMLQRCLDNDDPQAAGRWLAIGQAIEDLARLQSGEHRH